MSSILLDETTLHGRLIGIGKIRKDGSEEFHWLEKPIHNKIVAQGLDYLFQMNGTDTVTSGGGSYDFGNANHSTMFGTYNTSRNSNLSTGTYTYGCLEYMAYGTGTGSSEFNMTDLVNRVSSYSASKKTGYPMCGTQEISYGHYKLHISHISAAASEDTNVTEIGWYGRYGTNTTTPTNTYVMFSRVALGTPYELSAGEQLITTYELILNFSNTDTVDDITFFGLTDVDGVTPLKAQTKRIIYRVSNDADYNGMATSAETKYNFPMISTYGNGIIADFKNFAYSNQETIIGRPKIVPLNFLALTNNYYGIPWERLRPWFWTSDKNFPAQYSPETVTIGTNCDTSSSAPQVIYQPYTRGNFYRDILVIFGQLSPNNIPIDGYTDIHYINFNGMAYRFGYYADEVNPDTGETESVWHPQAIRKYGNKILKLKFRTALATSDTNGSVEVNSQEP